MEVIITRDDRWTNYYKQARDIDPVKYANTFWKTEQMYKKLKDQKVSRGVKFISMDKCPRIKTDIRHVKTIVKCQAVTMSGKPCPFRAVSECGKFCKKHI